MKDKNFEPTSVLNRGVRMISASIDDIVPSVANIIIGDGVGCSETEGSANWESVGHLSLTSANAAE